MHSVSICEFRFNSIRKISLQKYLNRNKFLIIILKIKLIKNGTTTIKILIQRYVIKVMQNIIVKEKKLFLFKIIKL